MWKKGANLLLNSNFESEPCYCTLKSRSVVCELQIILDILPFVEHGRIATGGFVTWEARLHSSKRWTYVLSESNGSIFSDY